MVLVGRYAPDFTAAAVMGNDNIEEYFNLQRYIKGKLAVVFFYPLDFTFVCPSELLAFNSRYSEFEKRNVRLVGVSIDSQYTHNAWRQLTPEQGGVGALKYPLVADVKHEICQAFGIEHPQAGVALRGSFLIDQEGIVRHMVVNDLPLGRNIDEMVRMVDALSFYQKHGEVCPAQWQPGQSGITATSQGIAQYLKEHAEKL